MRSAFALLLAAGLLVTLADSAAAAPTGTARGAVWLDADRDGRRATGEGGVSGVQVQLQRKSGKRWKPVARRRTRTSGAWAVKRLRAGRYRIVLGLPSVAQGFAPRGRDSDMKRSGRSRAVRLRNGKRIRLDAGLVLKPVAPPAPPPAPPPPAPLPPPDPAVLAGIAWHDTDGDGARGAGEPGYPNATLELWDADRHQPLASTTSDLDGRFTLTAPAPGSYRLRHVLGDGTFYSPNDTESVIHDDGANAGFSDLLALGTGTTPVTVGVRTPAAITIGDFVWKDYDFDGLQDVDEANAHADALVELWNDSLTQRLAVAASTVTEGYSLPARARGAYRVRFVFDSHWGHSPQNAGNDALDSDAGRLGAEAGLTGTLRPLASISHVDAGRVTRARFGNLVWDDRNGDGEQDAGEPGIAGVAVELWDAAKLTRYATDTTAANGSYEVWSPWPGDYRIRVLLPAGADEFSPKDAVDDQRDSDVALDGWTDPISLNGNVVGLDRDAGVELD